MTLSLSVRPSHSLRKYVIEEIWQIFLHKVTKIFVAFDEATFDQDYTRYLLFVVIYILLLTIIYMFFFKTELRRKNAGKILIKSQPDGAFPEEGAAYWLNKTASFPPKGRKILFHCVLSSWA